MKEFPGLPKRFTGGADSANLIAMTLDELTQQAESRIPEKFFFQIAEVCELTELPKSVLRFWESEFPTLKPNRTESGRRLYRRKDVILLFKIKHLLYESKFTIDGARNFLDSRSKAQELPDAYPAETPAPQHSVTAEVIEFLRCELLLIRSLLD